MQSGKSKSYHRINYCINGLSILLMLLLVGGVQGQNGERLFNANCARCHKIGGGKLVGPDLANVTKQKSEKWLIKFIKSSQTVIKSGDEYADSLYKAFNEVLMPDQDLSDKEIKAVLSYIEEQSPAPTTQKSASKKKSKSQSTSASQQSTIKPVSEATNKDIQKGRRLFAGKQRLAQGGPACISCHHVRSDAVLGGGTYAKELTKAFSRLGEKGVTSMIKNPAFPEMKLAYANQPLTDKEIFQIKAFLKRVDNRRLHQHPRNHDALFLWSGIGVTLVFLSIFGAIWFTRKRGSVNDAIYQRQVKSTGSQHGF